MFSKEQKDHYRDIFDYCENLKRAIHFMNQYSDDIPKVFTKEEIDLKLSKINEFKDKLQDLPQNEKANNLKEQLQEGSKMFYLYGVQLDLAATQTKEEKGKKKEHTLGELVMGIQKDFYLS